MQIIDVLGPNIEKTKKDFSKLLAQWSNAKNEASESCNNGIKKCHNEEEGAVKKPLSPKSSSNPPDEDFNRGGREYTNSKAASFFNEFLE